MNAEVDFLLTQPHRLKEATILAATIYKDTGEQNLAIRYPALIHSLKRSLKEGFKLNRQVQAHQSDSLYYKAQEVFDEDFRLEEVTRIITENELVPITSQDDAQLQLQVPAQRTFAQSFGAGLLLYKQVKVSRCKKHSLKPQIVDGVLKSGAVVKMDPSEENECHNSISTGLSLDFCDLSLLAMGLRGVKFTSFEAFQHLNQKDDDLTCQLLLGMSAAYVGTQDPTCAKVLSLHVPAVLQMSVDLNLSSHVQACALVSLGLLYYQMGNAKISQSVLQEMCTSQIVSDWNTVDRRMMAMAAGIGYGLTNFGLGSPDCMQLIDMVNGRVKLKSLDVEHSNMRQVDHHSQNAHVTELASLVCLSLCFFGTGNQQVIMALQFDCRRMTSEQIFMRVLTRQLVTNQLDGNFTDLLPEDLTDSIEDMAIKFTIMGASAMALGLRFAGTLDSQLAQKLILLLRALFKTTPTIAQEYHKRQYRRALLRSMLSVAMALALVMAGSGDLESLRVLRLVYGKVFSSQQSTHGEYLYVNMALGMLFMGKGSHSLHQRNLGSLIVACLPLLPSRHSDHSRYLQYWRHLWPLSSELRLLVTEQNGQVVKSRVLVVLKNGSTLNQRTPFLLPAFDQISNIIIGQQQFKVEEFRDTVLNGQAVPVCHEIDDVSLQFQKQLTNYDCSLVSDSPHVKMLIRQEIDKWQSQSDIQQAIQKHQATGKFPKDARLCWQLTTMLANK